ncbi:MAG: sugar phosphate isomerase/epimerase [Planctomycetaceae bacterium]|nr:sugar phosphate isomerase/epimerase [Planctomycetaceae bacterium]
MESKSISFARRAFLASAATGILTTRRSADAVAGESAGGGNQTIASPFRFCLNTSTIRGQKLGIQEEIRIAAEAGYDGIEPWIRSIAEFVEAGGKLADLRKQIQDAGLTVDSAIGFAQWIVDDESKRKAGLEEAKRDMDMLREIGGTRIAAPPSGANQGPKLDLFVVAERYRELLELGDQTGVTPQLEVWGFSANLSRLGETVFVCTEADHPKACVLPDVYHIFKGGSGFNGLQLLSDAAIQVFHMNDYPASPSRQEMNDSHRVYPGDGIAPLTDILNMIGGNGRSVTLSLELFNKDYWQQDALQVAKTGLQKMKTACEAAR